MTIAQAVGRVSAGLEITRRSTEFAQYTAALALAKGDPYVAFRYAERYRLPERVRTVLKTAVAAGTTSSMDAVADFAPLVSGFSATLANVAVFDSVLIDATVAPLHTRFGVLIADASAAAVAEASAKPLTAMALDAGTLQERRAATIIVMSDDLLRFGMGGSLALLENSLRTAVAGATDSIFLSAVIAATTPIASSGDVFQDLRTAMAAAGSGANSKFHLVVSPATAQQLALASTTDGAPVFSQLTPNGGTLSGITVHASDALSTTALLLDASALVANADEIRIQVSNNAALEMTTAPSMAAAAGSPPAPVLPGGSPPNGVVSMFQTDSTAIRCERLFGFELLRTSAAQSFSGVTWGTVGSPPV